MPMSQWFFVSDLHGHISRYQKLFQRIRAEKPAAVLLGGDLLPHGFSSVGDEAGEGFIESILVNGFAQVRKDLASAYPQVLLILGNDDPGADEMAIIKAESLGLWKYMHFRQVECNGYSVYGYACVPPTPFLIKDWERYDISRFTDPGCISPEEGWRSIPVSKNEILHTTIQSDLARLVSEGDVSQAIFLFHAPPYQTKLDRAALDGKSIDHAPLDVHVGSIAIRRFILNLQPRITLHGHIHESARLTGSWRDRLGQTWAFSAAHDGHELALVRFDPAAPEEATRELI